MATQAGGTIFKFTPSGGSSVTVGRLASISELAPTSDEIDVTTLDSPNGYREYIQGFRDSGTVELTGFFVAGDAGQTALRTAYASGAAGNFEIDFPDGTSATFSAFVKGFSIGSAEVGGAIGFGANLRITGGIALQ